MLPVVSLDPIPCSQVNILKNQRPPKKTNRESKFRGVGLRGENAERQSPQLCERTRRPGKPVNPRKAGWEMVGNNPHKKYDVGSRARGIRVAPPQIEYHCKSIWIYFQATKKCPNKNRKKKHRKKEKQKEETKDGKR